MEQQTFNQKSWYRALKVIFVLAFIFTQVIGFTIAYPFATETTPYVHCDNGKEFANPYFLPTDQEKLELFKQCDITEYFYNNSKVKGVLTSDQRQQLNTIIVQMENQGSLESDIQPVVDNFKTEYAIPNPDTGKKYTSEELEKILGHDPSDSFQVQGSNSYWIANFKLQEKNKHSLETKIIYYVFSFLIVSLIFWIISRIFFYIFAKEKFFKFSIKHK